MGLFGSVQTSSFVSTAMTATHTMINNSTEAIQVAGWETVFYITPLVWSESKQRAGDK